MGKEMSSKPRLTLVTPSLKDPRIMNSAAVTLWVILGQTIYFFNRGPVDLIAAIAGHSSNHLTGSQGRTIREICGIRGLPRAKSRGYAVLETTMPIIEVSGPFITTEQKRDMIRGLTDVAARVYDRPREQIIVIVRENQPENVGVGGKPVGELRNG